MLDDARASALEFKANSLAKLSPSDAAPLYDVVLAILRKAAEGRKDGFSASQLAGVLERYAQFQEDRHPGQALKCYDEALALLKDAASSYAADTSYTTRYVALVDKKAALLRRLAAASASSISSLLADRREGSALQNESPDEAGAQSPYNLTTETDAAAGSNESTSAALLAEAEALVNEAASIRRRLAADDPNNPNRHALIDFVADQSRELRRAAGKLAKDEPERAAQQLADADQQFRQAITALRERANASADPTHRERLGALLREQALFVRQQAGAPAAKVKPQFAAKQLEDVALWFDEAIAVGRTLSSELSNSAKCRYDLAYSLRDLSLCLREQAAKNAPHARSLRERGDELLREAITLARQLDREQPGNQTYRSALMTFVPDHARSSTISLAEIEQLIVDYPGAPGLHACAAARLVETGTEDETIEALTQRIERFPQSSSYYIQRAKLLNARGDAELAIDDYSKAIENAPNNTTLYQYRACLEFCVSFGNLLLTEGR
jgi:tetratricopeptide (TPR) repeat protein